MITLNDVLASERSPRVAALSELDSEAIVRSRRSIYKAFAEAQQREEDRAERSPLVVWAKRNLQNRVDGSKSKLSAVDSQEAQNSAL